MSKNIFLDKNQFVPNPKRNSYDLSKLVNGTYSAGYIYPVDWEEVTFGDSLKLDLTAALRTMPMVWPIQTPVIAKFYTFYVRYRTLMKNFQDFRFNNKQVVHPFIALNNSADFWKTGELGDHLGIPTTYASSRLVSPILGGYPLGISGSAPKSFRAVFRQALSAGSFLTGNVSYDQVEGWAPMYTFDDSPLGLNVRNSKTLSIPNAYIADDSKPLVILLMANSNTSSAIVYAVYSLSSITQYLSEDGNFYVIPLDGYNITAIDFSGAVKNNGFKGYLESFSENSFNDLGFFYAISDSRDAGSEGTLSPLNIHWNERINYALRVESGDGLLELNQVANPFAGSNPEIPISALIPRAYEACYRSHFQDLINEPFILNGEAQYNRYITNDCDGADYTDYKLFRRNWEADFLTSCKPSPQQGLAPIVGITSSGDITLIKVDGNEYTVHVNVNDDDMPTSIDWASQSSDSDISVRRTLLDLATSGISINALRNTNAFQKWLEANYRRGLKFRDQVLSNFGVKLEYKELDMPEFLGGFSIPLDVNTINQTSSSVDGSPLGDIAGNGGFFGRAKHSISHYCDEEGVVMTLMCITPIPVYSQLLNRKWLKQTPVDYYNPQFGKIGNQPVTYEEVCPIQAYNEGKNVHDVFGYQRPWYHLISAVDEVHGKMRSDMSQFLMQRIFGSTPELGAQFLHIDESQLNDVFVAKAGVTDSYYGQISIKKYKKTSIPRYNLPSLS